MSAMLTLSSFPLFKILRTAGKGSKGPAGVTDPTPHKILAVVTVLTSPHPPLTRPRVYL